VGPGIVQLTLDDIVEADAVQPPEHLFDVEIWSSRIREDIVELFDQNGAQHLPVSFPEAVIVEKAPEHPYDLGAQSREALCLGLTCAA